VSFLPATSAVASPRESDSAQAQGRNKAAPGTKGRAADDGESPDNCALDLLEAHWRQTLHLGGAEPDERLIAGECSGHTTEG